jgi:hypothetical protein
VSTFLLDYQVGGVRNQPQQRGILLRALKILQRGNEIKEQSYPLLFSLSLLSCALCKNSLLRIRNF